MDVSITFSTAAAYMKTLSSLELCPGRACLQSPLILPNIRFARSSAEKITPKNLSGTVDLVVSGQAAHWFEPKAWWAEMRRVVRREGMVAVWGYGDHVLVSHPEASRLLHEWASAASDGIGNFWVLPGRFIVRDGYRDIEPPNDHWSTSKVDLVGRTEGNVMGPGNGGSCLMTKQMKIGENMEFVRSWSAVLDWKACYPTRKAKVESGEGDVVDELFDKIKAVEEDWKNLSEAEFWDTIVDVEWGGGLVMAKKL